MSDADGSSRLSFVPFLVTLSYREPTYALRRGIEPRTHRRTYRVVAASANAAAAEALERFRGELLASDVGWVCEVVDTKVEWMGLA